MTGSAPCRASAPAVSPLELNDTLPPVERRAMDNGVELVTLCGGLQEVSRLSVVWPVGYADVEDPAAMRLLRPMLTEGTSTHTGMEFAEAFEFNGAWVKVESVRHMTAVTVHMLNGRARHVLPLIAGIIEAPLFPQEAFGRIREKVAASCEVSRRKVLTRAGELLDAMMFGGCSPLAHVVTPDEISAVGRSALVRLHGRLMGETRPRVYLAGALSPALTAMVDDTLGRIAFAAPGNGYSRNIVQAPRHTENAATLYSDTQSMQTALKMALPAVGRSHPDYETLRYTVMALGGHFSSRLMSNIREEKGYTYGISASTASLPEGAFTIISCQCDNRFAHAVEGETVREIIGMGERPLSAEELETVRSTAMTGIASVFDSPFTIMDYHQMTDLFGLPSDAFRRQVTAIRSLTSEKVAECAAKHLVNVPRLTAMAGNPV